MGNLISSLSLIGIETICIMMTLIQFIIFLCVLRVYRKEVRSLNNRNKALMDSNRKILGMEKMYLSVFKNILVGYSQEDTDIEDYSITDKIVTGYEDLRDRLKTQ